jgi:RNA binding exosome subunit
MDEIIPSKYYLGQNFPNPFQDTTKIKYCLPVKSKVTIRVFNSDCEIIKHIVNDVQEAGTYQVKFDRQELSSGEYLCVMEAIDISSGFQKTFNDTKKMVLQKSNAKIIN